MSKWESNNSSSVPDVNMSKEYLRHKPKVWTRYSSSEILETFVINVLDQKRDGTFVEIGANHYKDHNNTYYLETEYNWSGVALDINPHYALEYSKNRKTPCVEADAMTFDYKNYFIEHSFPKQIDFLQIDIDLRPRGCFINTLLQLPMNEYRFNIVSIEHGTSHDFTLTPLRDAVRYVMDVLGYRLVVQGQMDDIWIDPAAVPHENYQHLITNEKLRMPMS